MSTKARKPVAAADRIAFFVYDVVMASALCASC